MDSLKEHFQRERNLSVSWLNRANDFYAAVLVISRALCDNQPDYITKELGAGFRLDVALPPAHIFIMAHSLELILKAIIIQKCFNEELMKILESSGKKSMTIREEEEIDLEIPKCFITHDLCKLVDYIGLVLPTNERKILQRFTDVLLWRGKYPVPKTESEYSNFLNFEHSCMLTSSFTWHNTN